MASQVPPSRPGSRSIPAIEIGIFLENVRKRLYFLLNLNKYNIYIGLFKVWYIIITNTVVSFYDYGIIKNVYITFILLQPYNIYVIQIDL